MPKTCPVFNPWNGAVTFDTYGGKAILDFKGEAVFAELLILRLFQMDGWSGVWVDTYRGKLRAAIAGEEALPPEIQMKFDHVCAARQGCFDVFVWKNDNILFAESKRAGRDRIRPTQVRWLEAALEAGLSVESLLVVEWNLAD
ncbi:MAG TPA: hypothetical protein VIW67_26260 [Terriglobales bacterium]